VENQYKKTKQWVKKYQQKLVCCFSHSRENNYRSLLRESQYKGSHLFHPLSRSHWRATKLHDTCETRFTLTTHLFTLGYTLLNHLTRRGFTRDTECHFIAPNSSGASRSTKCCKPNLGLCMMNAPPHSKAPLNPLKLQRACHTFPSKLFRQMNTNLQGSEKALRPKCFLEFSKARSAQKGEHPLLHFVTASRER